jgi:hypothetical protein
MRIIVSGKPRTDIDPRVLLHLLLAIAREQQGAKAPTNSPDVFNAAIEDVGGTEQAS